MTTAVAVPSTAASDPTKAQKTPDDVLRGDAETYLKLARHRDGRVGAGLVAAGIGPALAAAAAVVVAARCRR